MSHKDAEAFKQQWTKFVTKVKGKLIKETKKQALDFELAQQILRDAKDSWASSYEANGRWLSEYNETDYKKGKRIHDILMYDMTFEEQKQKKNFLLLLLYLIPFVCAGAGFLIAMFLTTNLSIRISRDRPPAPAAMSCGYMVKSVLCESRGPELDKPGLQALLCHLLVRNASSSSEPPLPCL